MISKAGSTAVFSVAALYGAVVVCLAGPGFASFDTAYQWWMARHLSVSTLWPPTYVYSFYLLDTLVPWLDAPTSWFFINLVLSCLSAAGLAVLCARSSFGALLALLAVLFTPVFWLLIPHVWSDVALVSVLLAVTLLLLVASREDQSPPMRRTAVVGSFLGLFLACGIRHNAVAAAFPLMGYWLLVLPSAWSGSQKRISPLVAVLVGGVVACLFFAVHVFVGTLLSKDRADTWAITAIWDLQAISVESGVNLVPKSISPDTNVADLQASFDATNAVYMYTKSEARWVNSTLGLKASERADLRDAWWVAVKGRPREYLQHRLRATAAMIGAPTTGHMGTRVEPAQTPFGDNPRREFWWPSGQSYWSRVAATMSPSLLCSPSLTQITALFAFVGAAIRLKRRGAWSAIRSALPPGQAALAVSVLLSGATYLAGLFVTVPTADMRYGFWPALAFVLAAILICTTSPAETSSSLPTIKPAS